MTIFAYLIIALWVVTFAVWIVGAVTAKRTIRSSWAFGWRFRVGFIVAVFLLIHIPIVDAWLRGIARHSRWFFVQSDPLWGAVGLLITLIGLGTAVSARITLGRNWGMPMTERVEPELVTGGVYAYIRHPIYTGLMLAMLGTALGESIVWLIPLIASAPYFLYSALREDKQMLRLFPNEYPAYQARTKRLIPFVW